MNLSLATTEQLVEELKDRDYDFLVDVDDLDIEYEYDNRGLGADHPLSDFSDFEIQEEYDIRGLADTEENALANEILTNWNLGKPVKDDIRKLLEDNTGKLILKEMS